MPTIDSLKEQEATLTPLFLFDCLLASGSTERWSTHSVAFHGNAYNARLLKHNLFELQAGSDTGLDGAAKITITLANADSHFSEIERQTGFRGAQVAVQLVFWDLNANQAASEARVIFSGIGNTADEITESGFKVTFTNRLNLQRILLPEVRIQRRCPWVFPSTATQRQEALTGGAKGIYSPIYRCGYSPDQPGGVGNPDPSKPGASFTTCDYSRANCVARGMFDTDQAGNATRRFGGIEFLPAQILVRSAGEPGWHYSPVATNQALYNDFVPLVYGTAWQTPPIVFARNDGNLTHMEVLIGMGPIQGIVTVVVNNVEIPLGVAGADMTATGWYSVVTTGTRTGSFNLDFSDASGNPLGDPYGSMAYLGIVVPNQISNGSTLPRIKVLVQGLELEQFDSTGASLGVSFTNNPAWVLLDVLRRSGWTEADVDLESFAAAAAYCAQPIQTTDLYGNTVLTPRFECNLVVQSRKSAAEVVKGIRLGSSLLITYRNNGLLTLQVENSIALQQPALPDGSNSTSTLNGGWPVYEFSDGSAGFSGILRKPNGEPTIRLYSKSGADVANRLTVEFQDEYNDYQQDSLSLVDVDDSLLTGREVTAAFPALGLPNFDQATRMVELQLAKTLSGNTFVEFETTVKGVGITPGDIITVTYLKEGLQRQPFRVVKLAPGVNYQTVQVTAQWHDDGWYTTGGASAAGGTRQGNAEPGIPRPLVGNVLDANGVEQFGVTESASPTADGGFSDTLTIVFNPPAVPAPAGVNIPLVSLNPTLNNSGGTLAGAQTLYYAVSAVDGNGVASGLSFVVRATIPSGGNTNSIELTGLSFSQGTASFNVYRGPNPYELLLIANSAVAATFTDAGATATLEGPPDPNYNHANFYWRMELQPENAVNIFSASTIGNHTLGMLANDFAGALARITRGTGETQERLIVTNDPTTITVSPPWTVPPDSTSFFAVVASTWKFGGVSATSPAQIEVPYRPGSTVEISGRSANILDQESAYQLNPITPWQIGSGLGGGNDTDVPPLPVFGLNLAGQGTIELAGVGFTTLTNTHTVSAGTLSLFYWNELNSPTAFSLASAVAATDTTITLNQTGTAAVGDLIQVEGEILEVTGISNGGMQYTVTRGSHGSTAAAHPAPGQTAAAVYHLQRNVNIVPFAKDFFGSQASGSFAYSIFLPDVRVGAAEFFATNSIGNGPVAMGAFGNTVDQGLRTLSGGQISIQVEGYLAIQTDAAPVLTLDTSYAARDIFAVLSEAPDEPAGTPSPVGGATLQLRQGSTVYCTLTIPDGMTISNVVNGFALPPLAANADLHVDILNVPTAADTLPGRDLTVTIRL